MTAINPYLIFDAECEAAFNFYKSVFGGEFVTIARFKDTPPSEKPMPASDGNKLMHVSLPIGKGTILMGSDAPEISGKVNKGNNVFISINTESEDEAERIFNGLSAGGKVMMPMGKTFWGAYFGMFSDKFGIQWMLSYDYNQKN